MSHTTLVSLLAAVGLAGASARGMRLPRAAAVDVRLTEWKVELSQRSVPAGTVTFSVTNAGTIPHAFEVEGRGIERETALIQPGATATLTLTLTPGTYEAYCPVGEDSHKKLGMEAHLRVAGPAGAAGSGADSYGPRDDDDDDDHDAMMDDAATGIQVASGGPVIQILPGPFPFPDSVAPVLGAFGAERASLEAQERDGPYSNNVAAVSGSFGFSAWDRGAVRDSVSGIAEFTTRDGARWKLVMDRVQTRDVPHHPRFGGVILGLYYHGSTGVHTPLVPTINSAVALWSVGHLYRNGALVTNNAQVHAMLLSRTRRDGDFALSCWDCSRNSVEELQLQITPAGGEPGFDAPGGVLFLNWEKSRARTLKS